MVDFYFWLAGLFGAVPASWLIDAHWLIHLVALFVVIILIIVFMFASIGIGFFLGIKILDALMWAFG